MGVAGSLAPPGGGAPAPDPGQVAAIRSTITGDTEACAAFAEPARAALVSLNSHTLARTRDGDPGECVLLLGHVKDRVGALDPARLKPRRGLAGLFDSHAARLKAFRAAYLSTAAAAADAAADLAARAGGISAREAALDHLWAETRDAITALDAHITAARAWLDDAATRPVPSSPETTDSPDPAADTPTADEVAPEPEVATLPHPLETRLAALAAVRAVAIGRLPLLRAAQNADCRAPVLLGAVCNGIEAWRADWQDALGLAGRRPKKVRPDADRLVRAQAALADCIAEAERALTAGQARRAELEARTTPVTADRQAA